MTAPLPWSFTALSDFKNCPKSFYHKRVLKDVKEEQGEHAIWGEKVHKAFENRMKHGEVLPDVVADHEQFLTWLEVQAGTHYTERKIALNKQGKPCGFFDKDVWFRGVVDYSKQDRHFMWIVDYKTGKVRNDFSQLKLFALHAFAEKPELTTIRVGYYWLTTKEPAWEVYERAQVPALWGEFTPDLRQYAQAFKEDVWQPRQSGLCNGWCPVTTCEFWKPKRSR